MSQRWSKQEKGGVTNRGSCCDGLCERGERVCELSVNESEREREREFLQVRKMFYLSYQTRENDIFSSFFPPLFSMLAKIPLTKPIVKPSKVLIPYPAKLVMNKTS